MSHRNPQLNAQQTKLSPTFKTAFVKSLPVMAGYITLGIGFGLVYTASGLSTLGALLFSLIVYAGSMQYVSVNLILSAASPLHVIFMTLAVNLRHLFYSISMLSKYKGAGRLKPYLEFALTDETFSIVCDGVPSPTLNAPHYYFYLSLLNQIYWVTGTILGITLQNLIKIDFTGVDFSMTALFVVTFTDQILKRKSLPSSALGILAPLTCLLLFGSESFLVPSLALIILILVPTTLIQQRHDSEPQPALSNQSSLSNQPLAQSVPKNQTTQTQPNTQEAPHDTN